MLKCFLCTLMLSFGYVGSVFSKETQACSDDVIAAVADWAKINTQNHPDISDACKVMPDKTDTTIAVAAFDVKSSPADDYGTKLQIVAIIKNGQVLTADRKEITEDSMTVVGEGSYTIDTAAYRLSPDTRAFGVIFDSDARGGSCPDYYAERELTLWVHDGNKLRAVLGTNLYGWVNLDDAWCNKKSESAHITLSVGKTINHGFYDLTLAAHVVKAEENNGEYTESGSRVIRKRLHYDGKTYGSDMFREFWYPKSIDKEPTN